MPIDFNKQDEPDLRSEAECFPDVDPGGGGGGASKVTRKGDLLIIAGGGYRDWETDRKSVV